MLPTGTIEIAGLSAFQGHLDLIEHEIVTRLRDVNLGLNEQFDDDDLAGEIPEDAGEAFDMLWDLGVNLVEDPEADADAISLFAGYFSEMGGEGLKDVASRGISAVDAETMKVLLKALDADPVADLEDATATIVEFAKAAHDAISAEAGEDA